MRLLRALQTRDSRRPFAPPELWLAPAAAALAVIPVAAAASALTAHLADAPGNKGNGNGGRNTVDGYGAPPPSSSSFSDEAAVAVGAGLLVHCPHALPFDYRVKIFRQLVQDDRLRAGYKPQAGGVDADENQGQGVRPVAEIAVRRGRVLEDALSQILPLGSTARGRLAVRYTNVAGGDEAGIDAGGLFKELLSEISSEGFNPERGVFTATGEGLVYPSSDGGDSHEGLMLLELIGMMVGGGAFSALERFILPFFFIFFLAFPPSSSSSSFSSSCVCERERESPSRRAKDCTKGYCRRCSWRRFSPRLCWEYPAPWTTCPRWTRNCTARSCRQGTRDRREGRGLYGLYRSLRGRHTRSC